MTMPLLGDDPPREVLIDEGALHVDVAEEDAVHRVVEEHVEALHAAIHAISLMQRPDE
jgi:hypothetical protein